ncbi:MAG: hypothetical protein AAFV53_02770 [Myxococcota bacterium]
MTTPLFLALLSGCGLAPVEPQPAAEALTLLSPREQLMRLSIDLRGVHPAEVELETIAANPALYDDFADRYLQDPRFLSRVRELFNLRYLTRTGEDYGKMVAGASDSQVATAIGEEPLRLLTHIVENDLPYSEMVLADYTVASPLLAKIWDLDRADGDGWTLAHYTDTRPEAGVLTMNAVWQRYPSMGGNANRHRANAVSKMLLCEDYLSRPIVLNRAAVDQLTIDPEAAISTNEACQSCHASLDPLSAHFFGFFDINDDDNDFDGLYRPEYEEGWRRYADKEPAYYGRPTANLFELAEEIADDPRFVDCAVQTVFEGLTQRAQVDEDWSGTQTYRQAFLDSDLNIRELVRAIVTSEEYRAAHARDPDLEDRMGGVKLVSPRQLATIMEDLTGYRWSFGGEDGLTTFSTGLPILLGGIDGDTVTARNYDPSVGTVFIQERLAQAAAHHVVTHDLDPERTDDAILLPYVTVKERPDSDADLFEAQIRHLYLHVTGIPLEADAQEPQQLARMWEQLYAIEASPTAAWAGVVSAILRDPRVLTY